MYQPLPLIAEDLETLQERLRHERDPKRKPRLHLLVLLKSGQVTSRGQAAAHLALHRNTVAVWLRRYRDGGLEALLACWPEDPPAGRVRAAEGTSGDVHGLCQLSRCPALAS